LSFFIAAMATNDGNQRWQPTMATNNNVVTLTPFTTRFFFPFIVLSLMHPSPLTLFIVHILFKVFLVFTHKQEYSPSAAVDKFSPKLFLPCVLQVIGLTVIG
jgi:hypothetical protein